MVKRLLIAFAVIIALSGGIYGATLLTTPTQKPVVAQKTIEPISVAKMHELVNAERVSRGIAPLTLDERLNTSAQIKADDMTSDGYFDHVDPVTGVRGAKLALEQTGADCEYASENLTQNIYDNDSISAKNAWMNSQKHREAMLDSKYELVGYGISGINVVQHLCDLR